MAFNIITQLKIFACDPYFLAAIKIVVARDIYFVRKTLLNWKKIIELHVDQTQF